MFTLLVFYLTGKVAVLRARTTTHVIVCVPKYTTAVTPSRVSDCRGEKEEERNFFFVRSSPLPFFLKNRLLLLLCNGVYNFNPFYIYILHLYLFDIRRTKKNAPPLFLCDGPLPLIRSQRLLVVYSQMVNEGKRVSGATTTTTADCCLVIFHMVKFFEQSRVIFIYSFFIKRRNETEIKRTVIDETRHFARPVWLSMLILRPSVDFRQTHG